ncbi:MAG TPA: hypothetical protein EYN91_01020 [Candidatus Melainabacteria bacterium]|jgi:hypothetical protein|nr:hypothetical protein [Candidatus Melainabacteria bacterium]
MNLKLRLEKLADSRSWVRLHFADGTTVIGRVLRIGHDYIELESYGDTDRPNSRDYSKHLIPMNLVKMLTIESPQFAEAERRRLDYIATSESADREEFPELEG